jgi:methyltransferase (TIGR00027 family)
MKQSHASRTAEYMALFRALESFHPKNQRLFNDPFAKAFLNPSLRTFARFSRVRFFGGLVPWVIDRRWPGTRTSGIARTRFIDDLLSEALEQGTEQVVLLGAGFDCRAFRIHGIERVRVFEIDHPDTSKAKRENLKRILGKLPTHVAFIEIDFRKDRLQDALLASRFDPSRRSFFIWEGVTNYLTEDAVDKTLQVISGVSAGSQLVFTYVHRAVLDHAEEFKGTQHLMQLLQEEEEAWTFGLLPEELPSFLKARGFELISDTGSVEYRARYMGPAGRHMKGYEFYRLARASVNPSPTSTN